ncbi:AP-2 complex mu subunit protein, putative [Cryptosporidium muris RN66]|uniref:AP-2 complex mu subunit protein, putative n=1 Tax=Cryptosporidium muris (strain RN66) TaxID=441375 RepID=B6AAS8_CRYMR|nr:AP-2 complex mu subunit protein, putative [Cryptosporidium muris RN66]EEA05480.1 AP-2 complex mu subunit protein, putative [Cryptosporidium muris RN66]|eukprot:XP_002139829.1 AP-2 complex mu subunit protein [Cryptosporidium muris RN66]
MIHQFMVLNGRGDTIILRNFRSENRYYCINIVHDAFYKYIKTNQGNCCPMFNFKGLNYIYLSQNGLYFICTSMFNVCPSYIVELLYRIIKVVRDFCGVLNEESIRKNFILVYELIDEIVDYGYPQLTNTEQLKHCIYNEIIITKYSDLLYGKNILNSSSIIELANAIPQTLSIIPAGMLSTSSPGGVGINKPLGPVTNHSITTHYPKTISSNATQRPINSSIVISQNDNKIFSLLGNYNTVIERKNEIFVDIFERVTVVLDYNGNIVRCNVDGSILMKSYLIGEPELMLGFTDNIILSDDYNYTSISPLNITSDLATVIDDCNFHECVDINEFLQNKIIILRPPEGEFILMNYRVSTGCLKIPFKTTTIIEPSGNLPNIFESIGNLSDNNRNNRSDCTKLDFVIKIKSEIPSNLHATNLIIMCPVPKKVSNIIFETIHPLIPIPQSSLYNEKQHKIVWNIKRIPGKTEIALKCKITLNSSIPTNILKREIGPVYLNFEIPMFNVSNLQIKYLKITDKQRSYNNFRWVRYVTQSNSYVCRTF